jgi:hypothetical protein
MASFCSAVSQALREAREQGQVDRSGDLRLFYVGGLEMESRSVRFGRHLFVGLEIGNYEECCSC